MPSRYLRPLRTAFAAAGDPARAEGGRAYLKSEMPLHGVGAIALRRICRAAFAGAAFADAGEFCGEVLAIWRGAKFREERYAAIELTGVRAARAFQTPAALPMYEEMIVTGAWWDLVDVLATRRVGGILAGHPARMKPTLLAWSRGADLWKRRTAILAQTRFKGATDLELLYASIAPSIESKEFFLRKAIGWALRELAWWNPVEARRYVAAHPELSGLSKREALKNVARTIRSE
ncbi:MAG TPA: DNA alkylation repair protein [Haliangiales bacterium]|nr:DNA alkylation repair protein [Haliangiales bacterium]